MKTWLAVLTLVVAVGAAWADAAKPLPVKNDGGVPFVIQVDMKAQQNKLLIPKEMLGKLKADAGAEPKGLAKLHTVVVGMSLAMALAFGGVWMMKHRGQVGGRALALLVGAGTALAIGGAAIVWADVAPRPLPPERIPAAINGNIVIEVLEKGNEIKLVITRDQLAKLNGGLPIRPLPPGNIRPLPAPVPPGGIFQAVPLPELAPFEPKPLQDR